MWRMDAACDLYCHECIGIARDWARTASPDRSRNAVCVRTSDRLSQEPPPIGSSAPEVSVELVKYATPPDARARN